MIKPFWITAVWLKACWLKLCPTRCFPKRFLDGRNMSSFFKHSSFPHRFPKGFHKCSPSFSRVIPQGVVVPKAVKLLLLVCFPLHFAAFAIATSWCLTVSACTQTKKHTNWFFPSFSRVLFPRLFLGVSRSLGVSFFQGVFPCVPGFS